MTGNNSNENARNWQRWMVRILIGLLLGGLVAAGALGMLLIVNDGGATAARLLGNSVAIVGFAGVSLMTIGSATQRRSPLFVIAAMLLHSTALILWLVVSWMDRPDEGTIFLWTFAVTTLAIAVAHHCYLQSISISNTVFTIMRIGVHMCAWLAAASLEILLVIEITESWFLVNEVVHFLLGATTYLSLLFTLIGTVALVTLVRMAQRRRKARHETIDNRVQVTLNCPKCEDNLQGAPGLIKCRGCGFAIMLDFEEPRCECGYLLFQLNSAICPECGRQIPKKLRAWQGTGGHRANPVH